MIGRRLLDEMRDRSAEIRSLVRRHHGIDVAVFGSVARGDEGPASDVDFLVRFDEGSSLLDVLHLRDELSELLKRPVDVVSERALKPRDDRIRAEAIAL